MNLQILSDVIGKTDECEVTILMVLNIQSLFLTVFGLLGVLLAFATTFFFHYVVMGYTLLTVLDFLSLFLIVGIAADDMLLGKIILPSWSEEAEAVLLTILFCLAVPVAPWPSFIMCHTFYLAPAVLGDHATPADCMKWAYKRAGEAMLVAS